jgi:hypothetical protein
MCGNKILKTLFGEFISRNCDQFVFCAAPKLGYVALLDYIFVFLCGVDSFLRSL